MSSRIGFCCKWVSSDGNTAAEETVNQKSTTITRLLKLPKAQVEGLLIEKVAHNLASLWQLVNLVGGYPEGRRMVRFTSEVLPCYTHEVANWVYSTPTMRALMERGFQAIGDIARTHDVRLSFHPDHFVRLNTSDDGNFKKAMDSFEMHVDMMRMMGYAGGWHPHGAAINIHLGGKADGIQGFRNNWKRLSTDAQNLITIENDEFSFGLSSLQYIADLCPIVTDIFHEWVFSNGQYIAADDPRIAEYIIPSWRGTRPLGHFSQPREEYCLHHSPDIMPELAALKAKGMSKNMIRSHSDFCWNTAMNDWAISHLSWMDIEVEAKMKNRASEQLYDQASSAT
jgi:UV DNA damage endonuclease